VGVPLGPCWLGLSRGRPSAASHAAGCCGCWAASRLWCLLATCTACSPQRCCRPLVPSGLPGEARDGRRIVGGRATLGCIGRQRDNLGCLGASCHAVSMLQARPLRRSRRARKSRRRVPRSSGSGRLRQRAGCDSTFEALVRCGGWCARQRLRHGRWQSSGNQGERQSSGQVVRGWAACGWVAGWLRRLWGWCWAVSMRGGAEAECCGRRAKLQAGCVFLRFCTIVPPVLLWIAGGARSGWLHFGSGMWFRSNLPAYCMCLACTGPVACFLWRRSLLPSVTRRPCRRGLDCCCPPMGPVQCRMCAVQWLATSQPSSLSQAVAPTLVGRDAEGCGGAEGACRCGVWRQVHKGKRQAVDREQEGNTSDISERVRSKRLSFVRLRLEGRDWGAAAKKAQ